MPAFSYEVLDAQGQTRKGMIEADTAKAARNQLRAQAMVPLSVEPVGDSADGSDGRPRSRRSVFNATGLAVWTRQLAGLIGSGLPLERALAMASLVPASILCRDDIGCIAADARADMVHLADDLTLRAVWQGGRAIV